MDPNDTIIFYDGVCGLCNRLTQFLLKRDSHDRFRFASLQSPFAIEVLRRHGKDPQELNTIYVVLDHGKPTERLLRKARAVLFILVQLGGVWRCARLLGFLPTSFLDLGYDLVARSRYKLFGKLESCRMPSAREREKFIDV